MGEAVERVAGALSEAGGACDWEHAVELATAAIAAMPTDPRLKRLIKAGRGVEALGRHPHITVFLRDHAELSAALDAFTNERKDHV